VVIRLSQVIPIVFFCVLAACDFRIAAPGEVRGFVGPTLLIDADKAPPYSQKLNLVSINTVLESSKLAVAEKLAGYQRLGMDVHLPGSSDPHYQRLEMVFSTVHYSSHLSDQKLFPILIERPEFQAYTMGGREIIFYRGLIEMLSDDELAFVIGHELAHIAIGHIGQKRSRDVVNVPLAESQNRYGDFFSIANEEEADLLAIIYSYRAGYSPHAAVNMWSKLSSEDKPALYDLFTATHPSVKNRAALLATVVNNFDKTIGDYDAASLLVCNPIYCQ